MYKFSEISIYKEGENEVVVENNPTDYVFVAKGCHGAVFKISDEQCVKIFVDKKMAEMETEAYRRIGKCGIFPQIYETGSNYIIMEFIEGMTLFEYLQEKKEISQVLTNQILLILQKFKELSFKEKDFQLTNAIIDRNNTIRLVDLVNAFEIERDIPELLYKELSELDLLQNFMEQIKRIDNDAYIVHSMQLIYLNNS